MTLYCEVTGMLFKFQGAMKTISLKLDEQSAHKMVVISMSIFVFPGDHCNYKETENALVSILIMSTWR